MKTFLPSLDWRRTYNLEVLSQRRQKKHLSKIQRAGILSLPKESRILDVACGKGEMLDILTEKHFSSLTGLDLVDPNAVGLRSWRYVKGSALALPFNDNEFDAIICAHSLHHISKPEHIAQALKEAVRCLRPGGKLFLIDHYDSIHLRVVFAVLSSAFLEFIPWVGAFGRQLREEHEELYYYLDHWDEIRKILRETIISPFKWRFGAFFFYYQGEKKG